jgi:hypothetical protein
MEVAARSLLLAVQARATEAVWQQTLKLLLKTLRALTTNPNALSSRRLRKSTPAVAQCVLAHPELLDLVARLGFVDEGACFSLLKLDEAGVAAALAVVENLGGPIDQPAVTA